LAGPQPQALLLANSALCSSSSLPDQHPRTVPSSLRVGRSFPLGRVRPQPSAAGGNADPGGAERGAAVSEVVRSGCSWKCRRQDPSLGFHGRIRWLLNDSCEWARRTGPGRWAHLVSSPGETSGCMVTTLYRYSGTSHSLNACRDSFCDCLKTKRCTTYCYAATPFHTLTRLFFYLPALYSHSIGFQNFVHHSQ